MSQPPNSFCIPWPDTLGPLEDKYLPTILEATQLSSDKQAKTKPSGNVWARPCKSSCKLQPAEKARKPWKRCLKVGKAGSPSSAHTHSSKERKTRKRGCLVWFGAFFCFSFHCG